MSENWNLLRPQIEFFSKPFPRAAMAFANAHRDDVVPCLVDALAQMAANPSLADDANYVLHFYAMHLLAEWREPRAYGPLVALGHHSEETLEVVLGDVLTESFGRCLASVCDGNLQPLYALFEDPQASHWARNAALNALAVRVFEGEGDRDALIHYLMTQGDAEALRLQQPETIRCDLEVLDCIVSVATDIAAVEMLERIDAWFDARLLDETIAGKEWVQQHIAESFEECRQRELGRGEGYVRNVEKEMGWWSGFQVTKPQRSPAAPSLSAFIQKAGATMPVPASPVSSTKVGRNDACPCGSGKKYKKCHGMG